MIGIATKLFLGKASDYSDAFFTYNSPFVIMTSIGFFVSFLNLDISNKVICRIINFCGKHTFGVYLLHNHFLFREIIWTFLLPSMWAEINPFLMLAFFGASVIGIYTAGIFVEHIRAVIDGLFRRKHNEFSLLKKLDEKVNTIFD